MRLRLLLSESVRSLTGNLSTSIAATMTVLIGMFLLGLFIALGTWVVSWSNHVKRELVVKVYFCTDRTCVKGERSDAQVSALRDKLQANPLIKNIRFVPKAQGLKNLKRTNPDLFANGLPLPG